MNLILPWPVKYKNEWLFKPASVNFNWYSSGSIIIEVFTIDHGKCSGIVYGGSSRKQKRNFQIGNKISLNWKSKSEK